ncbi:MAG: hypothetical protein AAGA58_04500 [Verrucomicrobiota bacterium]
MGFIIGFALPGKQAPAGKVTNSENSTVTHPASNAIVRNTRYSDQVSLIGDSYQKPRFVNLPVEILAENHSFQTFANSRLDQKAASLLDLTNDQMRQIESTTGKIFESWFTEALQKLQIVTDKTDELTATAEVGDFLDEDLLLGRLEEIVGSTGKAKLLNHWFLSNAEKILEGQNNTIVLTVKREQFRNSTTEHRFTFEYYVKDKQGTRYRTSFVGKETYALIQDSIEPHSFGHLRNILHQETDWFE